MRNWIYALCVLVMVTTIHTVQAKDHASVLKNRFRIDAYSQDVTLWIHKKYQSPSVILVKPDGSKWYKTRHPDSVNWFSSDVGEIIRINQPMAGPWQILGDVVDGSKLYMVSDIGIDVDPIPSQLYQNEVLMITARVLGDDLPIRIAGMDFMLDWQANLLLTDTFQGETFTQRFHIGTLHDDGQNLDATAYDGIFTSNFSLSTEPAKYQLQIKAHNELFERSVIQDLEILPLPLSVSVANLEDGFSRIQVLTAELLDEDLLQSQTKLQVTIEGPEQYYQVKTINFDLGAKVKYQLDNLLPSGSYIVNAKLFSTLSSGRELIIDAPALAFEVAPLNYQKTPERRKLEALKEYQGVEQAYKNQVLQIVVVVFVLIILGLIGFMLWLKFKRRDNSPKQQEPEYETSQVLDFGDH